MNRIRKKGLFAILALLVIILAACSSKSSQPTASQTKNTATAKPSNEQVELNFANWISTEDATKDVYSKLIAAFESAHPNIKIKSVGIPFAQYKDQVLVSSSGGEAPDVMMANQGFTPAFVGAGIVQPLDTLLGDGIINDIVQGSKAGVTYNGKIMAMPWTPHPNALFWNKTLFAKAGLDPNTPPKTWDEMVSFAQKITALKKDEKGNPIYGIGESTKTASYTGQMLYRLALSYGGKFVDDQGKLVFDKGSALTDSLNYLRDLTVKGVSPNGVNVQDLRGMFGNGSLGMLIDGDFGRNTFRGTSGKGEAFDKEWGVITVPVGKTGRSETVFTEHQLLISKTTKHPKEAAEFINFLVSKDAMGIYHKSNGVMSSRTSIASLPEMNEDDYAKVFNMQMKTASPFPTANPKFDNAMNEASNMAVLAATSGDDVSSIISKVMPKIADLYKK